MGLFDKLFKKNEDVKAPEKASDEPDSFDTQYGRFYYVTYESAGEYGYECYIDWYPDGRAQELTEVYIDTDTPETTEAVFCYARFEKLFADRERTDREIKKLTADYFILRPELTGGDISQEELTEDMEISWIGLYRNGNTVFSINEYSLEAENISVIIKADGSREISYVTGEHEDRREHCDKL